MGHLVIAYNLLVVMIGFGALVSVLIRAFQLPARGTAYFCLVYALFTVIMILTITDRYLLLNVAGVPPGALFVLRGARVVVDVALVYAAILYWQEELALRLRGALNLGFAFPTAVTIALVLLPGGVVFQPEKGLISFGMGFHVASGCSLLMFTYAVVLGVLSVVRAPDPGTRVFRLGLVLFAGAGYGETVLGFVSNLGRPYDALAVAGGGFLISSIPFALYGVFLIVFLARTPERTGAVSEELSEAFRQRFGITPREEQIILLALRGKSNEEIAKALFISLATVKTHLHNVFRKAGIRSRFGLIHKARAGGNSI